MRITGTTGPTPAAVTTDTRPDKTQPSPHSATSPTSGINKNFETLKLELARRQLSLIDAQRFVHMGVKNVVTVPTDAATEEAVGKLWRGLANTPHKKPNVKALVAAAAARGPAALAQLASIAEAQRQGWVDRLATQPSGALFIARSQAVLDELGATALKLLLETPAHTDHRAAMASMLAAKQLMSHGPSLTWTMTWAHLQGNRPLFWDTNESGLEHTARGLPALGGAAVGVSGGLLHLARTTRAEAIILVDFDPGLANYLMIFAGILLCVDQRAEKFGWTTQERWDKLYRRLCVPSAADATLRVAELQALGLNEQTLPGFDSILGSSSQESAEGQTNRRSLFAEWMVGDKDPATGFDESWLMHLTQLALNGRILAFNADIGNPKLGPQLNSLLSALGLPWSVVNLSNALDYVPATDNVFNSLATAPHLPHGVVVMTTDDAPVQAIGEANPERERQQPTSSRGAYGTFRSPAVLNANEWLGPGRRAEVLSEQLWAHFGPRLWRMTERHAKELGLSLGTENPEKGSDVNRIIDAALARTFAEPQAAREFMLLKMQTLIPPGTSLPVAEIYTQALGRPLVASLLPAPASLEELDAALRQFDATFWTRTRILRFLRYQVDAWAKIPPQSSPREADALYKALKDTALAQPTVNKLATLPNQIRTHPLAKSTALLSTPLRT